MTVDNLRYFLLRLSQNTMKRDEIETTQELTRPE